MLSSKDLPHPGIEPASPALAGGSLPLGFPGGTDGKASTCNAGDLGSSPGSGRSPGEGNGNPFQYSCLENPWTEESSRLQSMGSQEVGHGSATSLPLPLAPPRKPYHQR